jgi:Domain of unknown function (DUF4129)
MLKKIKYIVVILLCAWAAMLPAQNQPLAAQSQPFNNETWKSKAKEVDYQDDEVRPPLESAKKRYNIKDITEKPKAEKPKSQNRENYNNDSNSSFRGSSDWSSFFKFFAIFAGVVILGVIAYYFLGGLGASDKKLQKEALVAEVEHIENNLPDADVETPLEKAIRLGEYKVAMRLYYLLIIQKMAQKSIISWRKDKTNREYANELRSQSFLPQFMSATLAYERAWFGEGEISKETFEENQVVFEQLKKTI